MPGQMKARGERQKDRQALFHRTLPATPRIPKSLQKKESCSKEEIDATCESNIKTVLEEHISYQEMYILLINDDQSQNTVKQIIQEVVSLVVSKLNHRIMNKKQADQIELSPKRDCRKRKMDRSLASPSHHSTDGVINN